MTLLRTIFLSAISVAVKMLALLGVNKTLAIYVGPAGFAAVGQFQNFIQIVAGGASSGIATAVVKYTAERDNAHECYRPIWRVAGTSMLCISLISIAVTALAGKNISIWLFGTEEFFPVIVTVGLFVGLFGFNSIIIGILNGLGKMKMLVMANCLGSLLSVLFLAASVKLTGYTGALYGTACYQGIALITTLAVVRKESWFKLNNLIGPIEWEPLRKIMAYGAMAVTSSVCVPFGHMLIRGFLMEKVGQIEAGNWEAAWRLSSAYLLFATSILSVYFLPKFSSATKNSEIFTELIKGYKLLIPACLLCGLSIFAFQDAIVGGLFSKDFNRVGTILGWQLVGDSLKIWSWLLAYVLVARAFIKEFIFLELIYNASFVIGAWLFINKYGLVGVGYAHVCSYAFYCFAMLLILISLLRKNNISLEREQSDVLS